MLVIIDAKPKELGLPTEAYIAVEEVHDVCIQLLVLFLLSMHNETQMLSETLKKIVPRSNVELVVC